MWDDIHSTLQAMCIKLWKTPEQARSLVEEAGIDSSQMKFDDPPAFRWQSIITEADSQRNLDILVPVLLSRYPRNPNLQEAVSPWIHGNPEEPKKVKKTSKPRPTTNEEGAVELTAPATIVVSSPAAGPKAAAVTVSSQDEEDEEPEMVPVTVPRKVIEKVRSDLLASMNSMKETLRQHEKDIQEIQNWREQLSKLSKAEMAVTRAADVKEHNRG